MRNKVIRRILELCKERDISVYKLSQMADIPKTTLNNMIAADRMPTIPTIEKICKGLDITVAQFFSSEELYPAVTESQQELLLLWKTLRPEERRQVKLYIEVLEKSRQEKETED